MKIIEANGLKFFCRPEPGWDDEFCVGEVVVRNVYKLTPKCLKNKIVVDIGANIGTFSIFAGKYAKDVYCYEPGPENFKMLEMNIALNKMKNIHAFNCAVGKPGEDTIESDSSGHSRIGVAGGLNGVPCKVIGFDEISPKTIDLLKMDCEGGEYNVIKYASEERLGKVKEIVGEFHSWIFEDADYKKDHEEMIAKLNKFFNIKLEGYKDSAFFGVKRENNKI